MLLFISWRNIISIGHMSLTVLIRLLLFFYRHYISLCTESLWRPLTKILGIRTRIGFNETLHILVIGIGRYLLECQSSGFEPCGKHMVKLFLSFWAVYTCFLKFIFMYYFSDCEFPFESRVIWHKTEKQQSAILSNMNIRPNNSFIHYWIHS